MTEETAHDRLNRTGYSRLVSEFVPFEPRFASALPLAGELLKQFRLRHHYLYTGAGVDELIASLDPEWTGPMPHSLLVDGDGKVIYRKTGIIDPVELSDLISRSGDGKLAV